MILSILIPVFNEEKTILELVRQVQQVKLPKKYSKEIVIVDDGSTDLTWSKLSFFKSNKKIRVYRHEKNRGKGAAIRTALKHSVGEIILVQDADLEYDPQQYIKLLKPMDNKKVLVVYGTRLKSYPVSLFGPKRTPLVTHYFGNKLLTSITNLLYGVHLTDMETCYKLIRKSVFDKISIESNRFEFEPEITAKILKRGIKIYEIPIHVNPRGYNEGKKISWIDGIAALKTLLRYRFFS